MRTSDIHTVICEDCEHGVIETHQGEDSFEYECATCHGAGHVEKEIWGCECDDCQDAFYVCTHTPNKILSKHYGFADAIIEAIKLSQHGDEMFLVFQGQFTDRELAWFQGGEYKMSGQLIMEAA